MRVETVALVLYDVVFTSQPFMGPPDHERGIVDHELKVRVWARDADEARSVAASLSAGFSNRQQAVRAIHPATSPPWSRQVDTRWRTLRIDNDGTPPPVPPQDSRP